MKQKNSVIDRDHHPEERDFAEKLANNAVLASEIEEYAVLQIYERLRPNDPSTPDAGDDEEKTDQ